MRLLFLFLDGVGLGADDAAHNPFATAALPHLTALLDGRRLLASAFAGAPRLDGARALAIATDACLGVEGAPQSATGQAAILTGLNAPRAVGGHWGPKPNRAVADLIERETVFRTLAAGGLKAGLLSGYPPGYFEAIASGRRNYSAVPLAVTAAGLPLHTHADVRAGRAFGTDFTNAGWHSQLALTDVPVHTPWEAGRQLAAAAQGYHFAFFEHWITDYLGHRGSLAEACALLEAFDGVLGGLLSAWDEAEGLIIITSDHGNLEDLSHRHHTRNPVPTVVVGAARHVFADGLTDLTGFAPAIRRVLGLG